MDSMKTTDNTDHKAVNQWMLANGWKLGKTSGAYVRSGFQAGQPGFGMMSAEAASEMYRMADGRVEEARKHNNAVKAVLGYREKELLDLKGPCSQEGCRLHYAHYGPCHIVDSEATHHPKGGSNG